MDRKWSLSKAITVGTAIALMSAAWLYAYTAKLFASTGTIGSDKGVTVAKADADMCESEDIFFVGCGGYF